MLIKLLYAKRAHKKEHKGGKMYKKENRKEKKRKEKKIPEKRELMNQGRLY